MKNKINIISLFIGFFAISSSVSAIDYIGAKSSKKNSFKAKAAGCVQAETRFTMTYNNVSGLIETGGTMWQDRANGLPAYEVPKNSGEFLIFSGALWVGGEDVNGQLKLAAMKFGSDGNDFWTGPLSVTPNTGNPAIGRKDFGAATIDGQTCTNYDKFYITERTEILEFNGWFETPDADKDADFPGYSIPASILNWPAHGDLGKFQDFYLAPFYDRDGDGVYNPGNGDYPWYDLKKEVDCRNDRQITLYGDYNMWWVFNDKGDIHTESGGEPIGMEIRGQAFSFATTDEVNNMTFYNYELINRSTQTLTNTFFAFYTDADVGCAGNDYVGCDIQRGLAFTYNKYDNDGANPGQIACATPLDASKVPSAIGIDFFEGPYQDNDGKDNPLTTDVSLALAEDGIPYKGLGIGYGDGVIDNERFGMREFAYYNNAQGNQGDPVSGSPTQFYNYMQGLWADGSPYFFGGSGYSGQPGVSTVETNYIMFGNTDPFNWATNGIQPPTLGPDGWTEFALSNPDDDKRMVQSAGPFTLEPGAVNNITVGAIYSRAQNGNAFQSVIEMRTADDKAQALFDNCFRILDGPDAPDVTIQEMDKTIILYLSNPSNSNNFNELYSEKDPVIEALGFTDDKYKFQGYKIYQMSSEESSVGDLDNPDLARLVGQCDIKDNVANLINYEKDPTLGLTTPELMVTATNDGIYHTIKITEDLFSQGDPRLVNHKKYYYLAVAYGYNNYQNYDVGSGSGQNKPYFQGRKSPIGSINAVVGIPHIPTPELSGTIINAEYGDGPKITRVEGRGNGDNIIDLTEESVDDIVNNIVPPIEITYQNNRGPIKIKVIDPLNVKDGQYEITFVKDGNNQLDSASWFLVRNSIDTIYSDVTIDFRNEQIIPEWGISVNIVQYIHPEITTNFTSTELLESTIEFIDYDNNWFTGVKDQDGLISENWIRSGEVNTPDPTPGTPECQDPVFFNDYLEGTNPIDPSQDFEKILEGTWAPYILTAEGNCNHAPISPENWSSRDQTELSDITSVDIVITNDRSKWTRVPVLESQDNSSLSWDGSTSKMRVKMKPSVDKFGKPTTNPSGTSNNANDANFISGEGMSWFPGYAIDIQSGERLNIAFSEDSWIANENGNDMIFNPTKNQTTQFVDPMNPASSVLFGGKHYVYIFKNLDKENKIVGNIGAYDNGAFFKENIIDNQSSSTLRKAWRGCMYVGIPLLSETALGLSDENDPYSYIESDVKIRIRVANDYEQHAESGQYVNDGPGTSTNGWYNKYSFDMDDIATQTQADVTDSIKDSIMNLINVVPNPYYAYSNYETNRLDNRIKIVNLPDECTIKIYTVSGTLVRTFTKDDSRVTSIDWDLTNGAGIPIAGGLYLIHVDVPSIDRERILKWFGVIRPPDLKNF